VSRLRLPLFFSALALVLSWSCKTVPPARKDVPQEKPAATEEAVEEAAEEKLPDETPGEQPQIVRRAEEVIEPLDKNVDVDLAAPVYNLNEPEVVEATEEAPPVPDGPESAVVLDEPVEKPEESGSDVPSDPADVPSALAEAPPAEAETVAEEPPQEEAEETEAPPPPPPAVALRPSERPASPPPVPETPPEPIRTQAVLPARNPPTETERYAKPAVSRTINVKTRQTFEVPFAETGWVYTGEENSRNGISYDSRRVQGGTQVFVFHAGKEGDYTLKFYKQDFLRDFVTNEYVRVIVEDEAPLAAASPAAGDNRAAVVQAPAGQPADTAVEASAGPPPAAPEDLLREAREAVAAEKYPDAIALLNLLEHQAALDDEAWWLYGQAFEAASPARDIRSALDAYSCIVRDYPQSGHYKDAQNRIAFLNRFYFNIR
jgi:hypothetical protein